MPKENHLAVVSILSLNTIFAASNLHELNRWARKWQRLQAYPIESRRYSDELSKITRSFTDRQIGLDNHSFHLNQVRTNEVALGRPWELREFKINQGQPKLTQVPVAGTPDFEFFNNTKQGRQTLGAILQLMDGLPDSVLGSSAPTPFGVPETSQCDYGPASSICFVHLQRLPSHRNRCSFHPYCISGRTQSPGFLR